jgi:hypothetical protein
MNYALLSVTIWTRYRSSASRFRRSSNIGLQPLQTHQGGFDEINILIVVRIAWYELQGKGAIDTHDEPERTEISAANMSSGSPC